MQFNRTLSIFLLLFIVVTAASAQQKYPATLLWRITGKNLTSPSYLYGTMHVQDRRLFYFGDSLYSALEKTQSFAMEINPDDMMDSLFKSMAKKDTTPLLRKMLSEAEYKKVEKQLEKKLKMPASEITLRKLANQRKQNMHRFKRKDDMPTMMDLYLFTIARNQGKFTSGIEDVADQLDIVNEMGALDIDNLVKDDSVLQSGYMEQMKKVYMERDLTTLNKMVNGRFNDDFKDILLIKRNAKMAVRIDSLMHFRSGFFAVGAAHLPGDSGIISLLQKQGFTVEPVVSSKYIAPEDYKYTIKEQEWQKVEDENKLYSVKMPGTPSEFLADKVLPMKMYIELGSMNYYGIAVTPVTSEAGKSDSLFMKVIDNYKKMGMDIKSIKNINYKEAKAVEIYAIQAGENHFRYRLIIKENKMFIIIFGSTNKENVSSITSEKYFNSLEFGKDLLSNKQDLKMFSNEKNAFTMMVPGKVETNIEDEGDGVYVDKYSAIDFANGNFYTITVSDSKPGYYIENDSSYFDDYRKNLDLATNGGVKEFAMSTFKNYPACHFSAFQKQNSMEFALQGYLVRRGGRTYLAMVACEKEKADFPEFTNFFRNFQFTPFRQTEWQTNQIPSIGFSSFTPAPFEKSKADTTAYNYKAEEIKYLAIDKNTAITYAVETEVMSPYFWATNDTTFFKDRINSYKNRQDSLVSYSYNNGPVKNATILIKLDGVALYKKLKLFLNGDTLYTLFSFQPEEVLQNKYYDRFFTEASFSNIYTTTIFENKTKPLLKALQTKDSATIANATAALYTADFAKQDLPLLYQAMTKKYEENPDNYRTINDNLKDKIIVLQDSSIVDFVKNSYAIKNDTTADVQMGMLELLANYKTKESYSLLKELLLNQTPVKGSAYSIVYRITDSMDLSAGFFPHATKLYGDTIIGAGIMRIANELLDSNKITAADMLQNEKGLYALAEKQLEELRKDKDAYPDYNEELIKLLSRFNTTESNALLNRFARQPVLWVKSSAVIALLKNNKPVAPAEINKFAANKEWRTNFYASLKEIHKTALFPKAFFTQQKFAESYLYNYLNDEEEVSIKTMQLVKIKTATVNGKQKRFYVYKVVFDDEDNNAAHLAICGAFDNSAIIADVETGELDIYCDYESEFSMSAIEEKFKTYIDEKNKVTLNPDEKK